MSHTEQGLNSVWIEFWNVGIRFCKTKNRNEFRNVLMKFCKSDGFEFCELPAVVYWLIGYIVSDFRDKPNGGNYEHQHYFFLTGNNLHCSSLEQIKDLIQ